jgi:cytochrome c-type biogenesis protein
MFEQDLPSLIVWVVTSALIDSIDPCFYALYLSIIASTTLSNIGDVLKTAGAFLSSVYLGYLLFGFLLKSLASQVLIEKWQTGILLLLYGLALIAYTLLTRNKDEEGELCKEDKLECKIIDKLGLARGFAIPYLVLLGLFSSLTILPCSAGLYIVYIVITTRYNVLIWLPLTMLYVLVFISPLILMTAALVGLARIGNILSIIMRHDRLFKTLGAVLALVAGIYLILAP